ncbi:hypothetical protein EDD15DRAFT_2197392 [Pisolithus albus]|nr:hypothetical protein EDD15DRAFT_2197392 [Pisolithus albus]
MLVQMKTIEFDHFSDFFGVANDLCGNQRTALSSTSISRILDIREDTFHDQMPHAYMRSYPLAVPRNVQLFDMPAAQKRVGFEREKKRWTEVIDTDSRVEPIAFIALRKISDEKSALYGVPTVRCGHSTTVTGVNRTKSTRCFQRKGVWNSGEGRSSQNAAICGCGRILAGYLRRGLRTAWSCASTIRESQPDTTAHRYQDFKDRTVAIVESLGQEAIRGSTPIAVHGVQLSPPATPAVPHFSRGYDPKRLLIVLQSPYEPVKASISSKSSKGRKGSMNQGWIQRRVFYYPSTSGTCIRCEICPTGRL